MFNLKKPSDTKNLSDLLTKQEQAFPEILEMAQIKQDVDTALLTLNDRGKGKTHLLASKKHYLDRQRRFAYSEAIRYLLEYQELQQKMRSMRFFLWCVISGKVYCIEKRRIQQRMLELNFEIFNQLTRLENFERLNTEIIRLYGRPITNEDFQREQPEYYEWLMAQEALFEIVSNATGFSKGFLKTHDKLTRIPIIEDEKIRAIVPIIDLSGTMINAGKIAEMTDNEPVKMQQMISSMQAINMSKSPLFFRNLLEGEQKKLTS